MEGISRAMLSDAGAWLARLNGPLRTRAAEEGFQQWLKDDPLHAEAFRLLSEDWEEAEELKRFAHVAISAPGAGVAVPRAAVAERRTGRVYALAAAVLVAVCGLLFSYLHDAGIRTDIGEQRILTLDDGTKVSLNTATHIVVKYDRARREVRLDSGEARFDVVKDPARPFVVVAGDRAVTALGTSFIVRRDRDERLAVTLVEGKVAVSGVAEVEIPPLESASGQTSKIEDGASSSSGVVTLAPGQRLTLSDHSQLTIDRPALEKVTAWQQGKVAIDRMRLADAVAEMNRYSPLRLVIEQPESGQLLVSGVFTAGQSVSFANAIAQSYGLQVVERDDALVLTGRVRVPD